GEFRMNAQKKRFDLPKLPKEYVIETSAKTGLNMQWERAQQIRPLDMTVTAKTVQVQPVKKDPKEILARCSAAEIDEALQTARAKDRKWILSMLLDNKEG